MTVDLMTAPGQTAAPFHLDLVPETRCALRPARVDDADQIHALIQGCCPLFRTCGQHAVVLPLHPQRPRT